MTLLLTGAVHAEEAPTPIILTDADKASVVGSENDFAADLYGQLREEKGDLFFSPESIAEALSMAYGGARAQTANDMQTVLHFRLNTGYTHAAMGELLREKNTRSSRDGYQFSIANALWVQKDYELLPDYVTLLQERYDAHAGSLAFDTDPNAAAAAINQWIEGKTQKKITTLITADGLDSATRLIITDAVYFKADWKTPFDKKETKQEDFHLNPAQDAKVQLMSRTCGDCRYSQNENYQLLAMPYKGGDIEMVIFLPRSRNGLAELEQKFNPQILREAAESLTQEHAVAVYLPRFRIESRFTLKTPLTALGMKSAFDAQHADFSGMTGKRDLFIADVIHKAYVAVDESGTEAAAATGIAMVTAARMSGPTPEFRADHPFLFLLRDMHTGAVYFMGRVENPA